MSRPFFSVILPTYNRVRYLVEAINSVKAQTFTDWEIVVVDDESSDGTPEKMKAFEKDECIRYHRQKNRGPGGSRNTAVSMAQGRYFAFLDDDDYFLPEHLSTHHKYITEIGESKAVFRGFVQWEEGGKIVNEQPIVSPGDRHPALATISKGGGIYPTSASFHREIFDHFRFNEQIKVSIDAECFVRILCRYPLYVIPEHTSVVRLHGSNLTQKSIQTYRRYIDTWEGMLSYPELKECIPGRYLKRNISKYYTFLTHHLQQQAEWGESLKATLQALRYDPRKLWKRETYQLLGKAILQR